MIQQIKKGITYAESGEADAKVRATVEQMIADIRDGGDDAVLALSRRLDDWSPESFRLSPDQIEDIVATLPQQVIDDIPICADPDSELRPDSAGLHSGCGSRNAAGRISGAQKHSRQQRRVLRAGRALPHGGLGAHERADG